MLVQTYFVFFSFKVLQNKKIYEKDAAKLMEINPGKDYF